MREYLLRTKRSKTQLLYREQVHFIHTHKITLNTKTDEVLQPQVTEEDERVRERVH